MRVKMSKTLIYPPQKNQHFSALAFSLRFAYGSFFILLNKQYNPISQQIPLWSPLSHACISAIQDKIYYNEISSQKGSRIHIPCLPVSNDKQMTPTIQFQRLISKSSWCFFLQSCQTLLLTTIRNSTHFCFFFSLQQLQAQNQRATKAVKVPIKAR